MNESDTLDYLVVGLGIAGLCFSQHLKFNKKSYVVFDDDSQNASKVAGGLCNPLLLARKKISENGKNQFDYAIDFYKKLEQDTDLTFFETIPILKKIYSVQEQNAWAAAAEGIHLAIPQLDVGFQKNTNPNVIAPFHFCRFDNLRRVDTKPLLDHFHLDTIATIRKTTFRYADLEILDAGVRYKEILARHIVFCEGYGISQNPFFNTLPIFGNQGAYLIISAKGLLLEEVVKSSLFIIPLGNDLYKVGATYSKLNSVTKASNSTKLDIEARLQALLSCPYEIIDQQQGIRPTSPDRRPIIGTHPNHRSLHILNGFGSRGLLSGPLLARQLFQNIENNSPIDPEIDCARFF